MSAVESLYETDLGNQSLDISAAERKTIFQTSLIIKQDKGKAGILSFLRIIEQESAEASQQSQTSGQTMTPTPTGAY